MKWIPGYKTELLPPIDHADYPKQYVVRIKGDDPHSGWIYIGHETAEKMRDINEDGYWEWLDESPTTADASVLKEALEEITKPIEFMRKRLQEGEQLNGGYAIQLSGDAGYLKNIAEKALSQYNALPGSQGKDIFNDKTIGKTIRDLPEKYSWEDIFEIGVGIPTGTKHFLSTYFKIPERDQSTLPNKIEESGLKEGEHVWPLPEQYKTDSPYKAAVYFGWYHGLVNGYTHKFTWEEYLKTHPLRKPKENEPELTEHQQEILSLFSKEELWDIVNYWDKIKKP